MSPKDKLSREVVTTYEKENLLKPDKVVVHAGANDALLFNNKGDKGYYDIILESSNAIIKDLLDNKENYTETNIEMSELHNIRESKAVELIYKSSTELDQIKSLLDVQKSLWNDVKQVTSIIISPDQNKIFIVDQDRSIIHQFSALVMPGTLEKTIDQIDVREYFAVFLSDFNESNQELYGSYAIAPVSITSMPILTIKREVEADTELNPDIAGLFDERSKIIPIPETDGTVTFTDREEETVKVNNDGMLEYYKYNVSSQDMRYTDMREAVGIAADYVNNHFGLKGDFSLSGIESRPQGGRTSFIISFDYRYNGMPVIAESNPSKSAIEVEVVGQDVKRYKRNVRTMVSEARTIKIKSFDEILNIVQGGLDQSLNTTKSEYITEINDLYLAYIERDETLIPVWVADVDVVSVVGEKESVSNRKYFIRAEDGWILDLDEQ